MSDCDGTCDTAAPAIRVRRATSDDVDIVTEMVRELAAFEKLSDECHATEEALQRFLFGPGRVAEALVAWMDEIPVGFAVYYVTFSTFTARPGLWVEDLFIRERFRRRGFGRHLLREVARIAHVAGAGRLEWNTLRWNEAARQLYASVSATELGEWVQLRMEAPAIAALAGACQGHAGQPHAGCRCGGRGHHHHQAEHKGCGCGH